MAALEKRKEGGVKDLACIGTLCQIHPSLRSDPFQAFPLALAGKPKPIAIRCPSCRKPVRRAYSSAQLTDFVFGLFACGCTGFSQFGELADPTLAEWSDLVTEAKGLGRGAVKVRTTMMEDSEEAGGLN
jgi:hypothetical protein